VKVAINDLSFQCCFYDLKTADDALHVFLKICLEIKNKRYRNVEGIWSANIDKEFELVPGYKLIKLIQNFKTHEERGLLISLLANAPSLSEEIVPIRLDGKESYICAFAKDGVVISLNSHASFSYDTLRVELSENFCDIRNIAQFIHISQHSTALGRRIYEGNPKHHQSSYARADMIVSPMDLNEADAQDALDRAVEVDGRIFSKVKNAYYEFRKHHDNFYHGYRNDQIEANVKRKIEEKFMQR